MAFLIESLFGSTKVPRDFEPLKKAHLTLTRHSSIRPDSDGLVSSFKHVIDGLVDTKIIVDDDYKTIGMPTYLWEKAPAKKGYITIKVEGE